MVRVRVCGLLLVMRFLSFQGRLWWLICPCLDRRGHRVFIDDTQPHHSTTNTEEAAKAAGKGKGAQQLLMQGPSSPDALINFRQLRVFGVQAGDIDLYDGDDITKVKGTGAWGGRWLVGALWFLWRHAASSFQCRPNSLIHHLHPFPQPKTTTGHGRRWPRRRGGGRLREAPLPRVPAERAGRPGVLRGARHGP